MRQALAMSLNIPAVKTLYLAGVENTINMAHRLGITTLNEKGRYGLALVLGGGEVTLLDETAGFSVFANDGQKNAATAIMNIVDGQGKVFYEHHSENQAVLDPQIARKINSILSDNDARAPIFGSANKLHIPGRVVAAKTGTTQEFHDAWTVGFTPSLATGVWAGNNDNSAMKAGADGSYVAAPIWFDFMSKALENYPAETFPDYDHTDSPKLMSSEKPKITYYDKKSGDKLSEKERTGMSPSDIRMKIEYGKNPPATSTIVEFSNLSDPMIARWRSSINLETKSEDKNKKKKN
jgi:membrane peptidoglycan carboxypeptidase